MTLYSYMHMYMYITSSNRWLKASGVVLAGEKRQRCVAKELVGDNITAEPVLMSFSLASCGEEIRAAAYAYSPDLKAKVFQILEQNVKRYNSLICRHTHIYIIMSHLCQWWWSDMASGNSHR